MPPDACTTRDAEREAAASARTLEKIYKGGIHSISRGRMSNRPWFWRRMHSMTASARSLTLEETLLEPPALPAPPTRHVLFVILIALTALLHVATIGTGDLSSQAE